MQKWEYLYVMFKPIAPDYETCTVSLNDKQSSVREHSDTMYWHLMNELGDQGWELVDRSGTWVFKRPKS